jgi:mono/diheme cytochrome c family protein
VKAADPPPPISGGTLAVAPDGNTVVAADSDRDRVNVIDLASRAVRHSVELPHRSEPGRVTIDDGNRAHVALRGSNEIATIDLATGAVSRRAACTAPRGIAWDATHEQVLVACAAGQLVSFAPEGGEAINRYEVGRDVRDVLPMSNGKVKLTRFRLAQLLRFDLDDINAKPQVAAMLAGANLAWRAVVVPSAQAPDPLQSQEEEQPTAVVAQEPTPEPVSTEPGGYGGSSSQAFTTDCTTPLGIVSTRLELEGAPAVRLPTAVLPVDLATNGEVLVVVAAGHAFTQELPQLYTNFVDALRRGGSTGGTGSFGPNGTPVVCANAIQGHVPGQAIAAAFAGERKDRLIVQTREPAAIHIMNAERRQSEKAIALPGATRADTGHVIFHANAGGFLACASCHAEGGDDGHTWTFQNMGPRRTPSLLGTVKGTEPFLWDGDMTNLRTLVDNVFTQRMSGPEVVEPQLDALGGWVFALPPPARMQTESDAAVRGKKLFDARCTSCHDGPMLTNNRTVDVGTGKALQVPSLVGVAWRAPYIHTGCAQTLFDRFTPECGGTQHGDTRDLLQSDIRDLVAFLETL